VTSDDDVYHWVTDTANASTNSGLRSAEFKRNGYVIQMDRDNSVLRRWQLYGLWPMSFTAGAWDNNSDEMTIEQLVLALDYFVLRENFRVTQSEGLSGFIDQAATFAKRTIGG
jgi:phage tail-like protein